MTVNLGAVEVLVMTNWIWIELSVAITITKSCRALASRH